MNRIIIIYKSKIDLLKKYNNTVYLLKIDTPDSRLYKIGSTRGSINKRIRELQTGCPYEIKLVEKHDSLYGQTIERTLHNLYVYCKTFGEWFALDLTFESSFLETCIKLEECNNILEKNKLD